MEEYGVTPGNAYASSIPLDGEDEEEEQGVNRRITSYTAPAAILNDRPRADIEDQDVGFGSNKISDRESEYQTRRLARPLSPSRYDPWAMGDKTPAADVRTYGDVMRETMLERERQATLRNIERKQREDAERAALLDGSRPTLASMGAAAAAGPSGAAAAAGDKKRSRWGEGAATDATPAAPGGRWDATPGPGAAAASGPDGAGVPRNRWDETPRADTRWDDATPGPSGGAGGWATPGRKKSRWDETPAAGPGGGALGMGVTPAGALGATPLVGATPMGLAGMETPGPGKLGAVPMTPEMYMAAKVEREMMERNRPLTDEELDQLMPQEGYKIVPAPSNYEPIRTPSRKLMATPTPMAGLTPGYVMPEEDMGARKQEMGVLPDGLPELKPEDQQFFGKLMSDVDESELSVEQARERRILKLLLKIKNGSPPQRKSALKQITDKARELGAGPLFDQILPILMSPTTEDQERHLMVKVIDRILFKLQDLVRPYVHKILIVVMPMLIDEDYYARIEGREIIANLSKAAGLAAMISALRPDIDNADEYVRNTASRAFAVVASAHGVPALLPFLSAVTRSKKSWQARHTGIKVVQQIAILLGCAVLPHLTSLVEVIQHGLDDEHQKVRIVAALAISALAEASSPYGIESFFSVLEPLWRGTRQHRGKVLAAFLKAIGHLIPLMDPEYANYYTKETMLVLLREFQTQDEEMKKIVLKVVKQCVQTEGVEPAYVRQEILQEFFKNFWQRKMALDRRNYKQLVETTVALAEKVGCSEVIGQIKGDLKDESEPYRKMVMETVDKVVSALGTADIDARLEEELVDGVLYAYQEQSGEDSGWVVLNGFASVVNGLKLRAKPYLPQICGTIKWRLNNKSPKVRQQAADLIARIAPVMHACGERSLLQHLGQVLYEYLGEEYPDVLASILGALKSIVNVLGMQEMNPPIKDLLPRLTPILKNRHDRVQENCIDLVGRVADRGAEMVPNREWMRICFDLLDMLRAPKKAIRRATVNTFGYIAKAIGPQDVLVTLLNNLKVQERVNRVCTTVAIAIVAETCFPFTVLPALMNEYKVPEINVQNGVLKSLSFMFEYIGEMGKDYIYAVVPVLEDALMDRDLVHRQTAAFTIQHLSLGAAGLGCEDALVHLLNLLWPNIFEASPHIVQATTGAIDGLRLALGPCVILFYLLQGLYHPARKVREVYWRLYNNLYLGSQDALVAFYPRFEDEGLNTYARHELLITL